jgi:hypothetical protein
VFRDFEAPDKVEATAEVEGDVEVTALNSVRVLCMADCSFRSFDAEDINSFGKEPVQGFSGSAADVEDGLGRVPFQACFEEWDWLEGASAELVIVLED